jgi:hypothetical protein
MTKRRLVFGMACAAAALVAAGLGVVCFHGKPPTIAEGSLPPADWTDWDAGAQQFTGVLQRRFPPGSSEAALKSTLRHEGFGRVNWCHEFREADFVDPRGNHITNKECAHQPDLAHSYGYGWTKMLGCGQTALVWWSASAGRIVKIRGHYSGGCM